MAHDQSWYVHFPNMPDQQGQAIQIEFPIDHGSRACLFTLYGLVAYMLE
jgi:hypothetical protein